MTDANDVPICTCFDDWHANNAGNHALTCPVIAAFATLTRERDEARNAFDTVISLAPIYCERLHHTKKDYHESGEPCPVEARIKTLIQIIEGDA
jgi:hypothetical protein